MKLSIFTDELGVDITEGIGILKDWGFKCLDFRSRTFGKATEALDGDELARLAKLVDQHGMKVTCLESSLAKAHLPDATRVAAEMQKLENLIRAADALKCRTVRTFFFWQPKGDERGCLNIRPDMLQRVMDLAGPMCHRAKQAGLTLAFENCGVTVPECNAVLDCLGIEEFGLAWDCANEWLGGEAPDAAGIAQRAARSRVIHVKAAGLVEGLAKVAVPWDQILLALAEANFRGPVSVETHNPDKSVTNMDMSRRAVDCIRQCWPGGSPAVSAGEKQFDFKPVKFVVVGLGMGANRAKEIQKHSGVELAGVCDIDPKRAEAVGTKLGTTWTTQLEPWLQRSDVEAVFVVTPTGLHAEVAIEALRAGKHVIVTKPMDANVVACDRLIDEARKAKRILAVDFSQRLGSSVQRMKQRIDQGVLGRLLGGNLWLKINRTMEYFRSNGGWRGTWKLDGGGAMSNQAIHHIDELIYLLGMPARVRMNVWTQNHQIEAEDLGCGLWEYASGAVIQVQGTTSFPQDTWYNGVELHGTDGAVQRMGGGPCSTGIERWFVNGAWETKLPPPPPIPYDSMAQNLAAAIRTGSPLICDGPDGRRSRIVLDAMYDSARRDGQWVTVPVAPA